MHRLIFAVPLIVGVLSTHQCEPPYIHLGGETACQYDRPRHCRWHLKDGYCEQVCMERQGNITSPKVLVRYPKRLLPNGPIDAGDFIDWGPGGPQ